MRAGCAASSWEEGVKMKLKERFKEAMMSFFVCTACITVLEGVMGVMFFPDAQFGYEAFFSPPLPKASADC